MSFLAYVLTQLLPLALLVDSMQTRRQSGKHMGFEVVLALVTFFFRWARWLYIPSIPRSYVATTSHYL